MKRSFSLRTRVAAATALGATIVVVALGIFVSMAISRNNLAELDRRLETASDVLVPNAATAGLFLGAIGDEGSFAVTVRTAGGQVLVTTPTRLPELEPGWGNAEVDGTRYRVFTAQVPVIGALASIAVPYSEAQRATANQNRQVIVVGVIAVASATALGWLFGGRAVRPLVDLTHRISRRDTHLTPTTSGVREADELAAAAESMLRDVSKAQTATNAALATARDFAAVSAHEIRTPLTAMRTDIEVLRAHELHPDERSEILGDLARSQGRVESTLTDLERLAKGELSSENDFVDCNLGEICDVVADDAKRTHPGVQVTFDAADITVRGLPGGIRLTLGNAITNAVRHGGAERVHITLAPSQSTAGVVFTIDDDGSGIPESDRTIVFERFQRGSRATKSGSGLGLALVAQQAALHGGRAFFTDSPLGGARLVVTLHETATASIES